MFYSTEILALKNKTSLALLFYISTTNNNTKRVHKKEIEGLNITKAIITLQHPPQPFALRLYSILIKGLVRIYSIKIKYCESELNLFHKSMYVIKRKNKKEKKRKALNLKLNACLLQEHNDFMQGIEETTFNRFFDNTMLTDPRNIEIITGNNSNNFEPGDYPIYIEENCNELSNNNKRKKIDKKIEISENKNLVKYKKINEDETMFLPINDYFICQEITNQAKLAFKNKIVVDNSVEFMRKDTTISFAAPSSNSFLPVDNFEIHDYADNEIYNNSDEKSLNLGDYKIGDKINFNGIVKGWSKKDKSIAFLDILNGAKCGNINPIQKKPYEDIIIELK
ncbi:R8 protein [Gurleya vavrai]